MSITCKATISGKGLHVPNGLSQYNIAGKRHGNSYKGKYVIGICFQFQRLSPF